MSTPVRAMVKNAALPMMGLAFCLSALPAAAQDKPAAPANAGTNAAAGPAAPAAAPETLRGTSLFGDWGGVKSYLASKGVNLSLEWTSETGANVAGGKKNGVGYADERTLWAHIDMEKLVGIPGLKVHAAAVNRAGSNYTSKAMGDPLLQSLEIYGATDGRGVRIPRLYLEQSLWNDRVNIQAGRGSTGSLAQDPFTCNFLNLAECGMPRTFSQVGGGGAWPNSVWFASLRVRPTEETYVAGSISPAMPFPGDGIAGFNWSPGYTTSHMIGQDHRFVVGWTPKLGESKMPGEYRFGAGYDNRVRTDLYLNTKDQPLSTGGVAKETRGASYYWFNARQMVLRNGPGPDNGVVLDFFYVNTPTDNVIRIRDTLAVGVSDRGFWSARPEDQINFSVVHFNMDKALTDYQTEIQAQGRAFPKRQSGVQKDGWVIEANYNAPIYKGVQIQPGLQYWINPGAQEAVSNALVLTLKTKVTF